MEGEAHAHRDASAPALPPSRLPLGGLPGAIMLDDVVGTERVWALFGPRAFELGPRRQQMERGEKPSGEGLSAAFVEWKKE